MQAAGKSLKNKWPTNTWLLAIEIKCHFFTERFRDQKTQNTQCWQVSTEAGTCIQMSESGHYIPQHYRWENEPDERTHWARNPTSGKKPLSSHDSDSLHSLSINSIYYVALSEQQSNKSLFLRRGHESVESDSKKGNNKNKVISAGLRKLQRYWGKTLGKNADHTTFSNSEWVLWMVLKLCFWRILPDSGNRTH